MKKIEKNKKNKKMKQYNFGLIPNGNRFVTHENINIKGTNMSGKVTSENKCIHTFQNLNKIEAILTYDDDYGYGPFNLVFEGKVLKKSNYKMTGTVHIEKYEKELTHNSNKITVYDS